MVCGLAARILRDFAQEQELMGGNIIPPLLLTKSARTKTILCHFRAILSPRTWVH